LAGAGPGFGPLTSRFPAPERTLLHVLRQQAREIPDRTWLVFDRRDSLTFGEAQDAVNRFGHAVRATVPEPAHVALLLRNQIEFMPAFLGAMAAGGIAIPLNPELRGPLLHRLLAQSEATILVVRADLVEQLRNLDSLAGIRLVVVAGAEERPEPIHGVEAVLIEDWLASRPSDPPAQLPSSDQVGSLIFTSGTTGGSKGVVCSHHYLYLFSSGAADSLGHTAEDVLTTPLQLCHVAGLHVIANSALHVGCTAHMQEFFSASSFWQDAAETGATFCMLMAQMAQIILRNCESAPEHRLNCIYLVPCPPEREEFERRFRTNLIWQGYGLTEIFANTPKKDQDMDVERSAIGIPPPWLEYGVVDAHDRLVPPRTEGELVFRPRIPDVMSRGYYKDAEATATAFRNFMFHTGDLGFYDEQGRLHFLRRMSETIRRGGENISAVELEAIALQHPQVVEAAAYAVASDVVGQDVKLDVALKGTLQLADLHAWLSDNLPRYMVPRYLERIERMPTTPSQKIEKYKLQDRPLDRPEVEVFEPTRRVR
jgi:crotonobetaine/carnitine-CoA ligase